MLFGVIGGPKVADEPPLELSTAMFFNMTKSQGDHYVPFSNHKDYSWSYDATPWEIIDTFTLPSGIGPTCVLDSPDWDTNDTQYGPSCQKVLWQDGKQLPSWPLNDNHPSKEQASNNGKGIYLFMHSVSYDCRYFIIIVGLHSVSHDCRYLIIMVDLHSVSHNCRYFIMVGLHSVSHDCRYFIMVGLHSSVLHDCKYFINICLHSISNDYRYRIMFCLHSVLHDCMYLIIMKSSECSTQL